MKSYKEMVQYVAEEVTTGRKSLRYVKWVAAMMIAETYGIGVGQVHVDIETAIAAIEKTLKQGRRQVQREINEQRRLANIARKQNEKV